MYRNSVQSVLAKCGLAALFLVMMPCVLTAQSSPVGIVITEDQANHTISAHRGELVTIKLPSQPGTGYSWQFSSSNAKVATLDGQPEILSDGTTMPGGVETQVFHVRIRHSGKAKLLLKYVRPWEKSVPPQKTFMVTVHASRKDVAKPTS